MANSTEPLWLKIRNHPSLFCLHPTPEQLAVLLRFIADEVVPDEGSPNQSISQVGCAMWLARDRVRDRLLDEADAAEAEEKPQTIKTKQNKP